MNNHKLHAKIMEYKKLLQKEFIHLKLEGVFSSCGGILECPHCNKEHKDSHIIGWGIVSSFHKQLEPAIIYECPECFTKSYAHMFVISIYDKIKSKFG